MKKTLLIAGVVGSFLAAPSFAQTIIVGADPEPRNVVLEEFSGIYCGYCPDGADRANAVSAAYPGRVVLVKLHSSDTYSKPKQAGHPDFRTTHGPSIAQFSGLTGYPAGMVNRTNASPPLAMSRSLWMNAAGAIINGGNSPVNIGLESNYDAAAKELSIRVQLYYTDNSQVGATNRLNVVVTEDGIVGYQSDYGPHGTWTDYEHNETVRSYVTGADGAKVTKTTIGNLTEYTYTYKLDASYNIKNMHVAAFVTEGNKENAFTGVVIKAENKVGHSGGFNSSPSTANQPTGIEEAANFTGVSVYPNPTNGTAFVNVSTTTSTNVSVDVYNVIGEQIANPYNGVVTAGVTKKIEFDTRSLNNGIYFVTVRSGDVVRTVKLHVAH